MAKVKIALVGLGAIGGSIGLALRQAGSDAGTSRPASESPQVEIIGHDKDPHASRQALKIGAVHKSDWNLISTCEGADLVILAIPLLAIRDTLKAIAPYLREDCVVTDTATVKKPVLEWAEEILPKRVHFIGGDPIVATTESGIAAAKANLFQGATWCLSPTIFAASEATQLVTDIASFLGAKPYFVDPVEHDGLLAATDHLPLVLAATLLGAVSDSPALREMSKLGGRNFAQVTLPATAEVETSRDICLLNRENIARWLKAMETALHEAQAIISGGETGQVQAFFERARENRDKWLRGEEQDTPTADYQALSSMGSLLFGRLPAISQRKAQSGGLRNGERKPSDRSGIGSFRSAKK